MNIQHAVINKFSIIKCEICEEPCEVIATDHHEEEEERAPDRYFCQKHYDDWRNNEIEIPAERLEVLE